MLENNNELIYNNYNENKKVSHALIKQLRSCDSFYFSVAFISKSGLILLKQTLLELEKANICGKVITSTYLDFNDPAMFEELLKFNNIEVRISNQVGFHPKGYIFNYSDSCNIIIGSSNLTQNALAINQEWNVLLSSLKQQEIVNQVKHEFEQQWNNATSLTQEWINEYKKDYHKPTPAISLTKQKLSPNSMQKNALASLKKLRTTKVNKALIISATGTGKTYLSAFDVLAYNPKRLLFVVHRENIAAAAKDTFSKVISNYTLGIFSGEKKEINCDYLFSTIQTISKDKYLHMFNPNDFDYIIVDEVHHIGAITYQKLINYFKPKFLLGMSATPERNDNFDIYKLFDYNVAYEIRLQQAMKEDLLCPFHYFGVSEIFIDNVLLDDHASFNNLILTSRIDHIITTINTYGYSGDKVRGLIFCRNVVEAKELSNAFNLRGFRTVALSSEDNDIKRNEMMDHLEEEENPNCLDYIFSVDIFNEGIDIPKVNQVIMLRPTASAIIFVQQLGRGLRKDRSKEYVTIIDFIGNYEHNFLIPIALSGNTTYNKDTLRRFVYEGGLMIPGASSINFDEISRHKIYEAIDQANFSDISLIKDSYYQLKLKLGRIPSLIDFDSFGSIDVLRIFDNKSLGSYHKFLSKYDNDYNTNFNPLEEQYLEYLSVKFASGKRIQELIALNVIINNQVNIMNNLKDILVKEYQITNFDISYLTIVNQLTQNFATGGAKRTYQDSYFMIKDKDDYKIHPTFLKLLKNKKFKDSVIELINFGISRYNLNYSNKYQDTDFVLYEKYTYEDVCRLLNWEKNLVPLNIGGYKYDNVTKTMPLFINHDKSSNIPDSINYDHKLIDNQTLISYSKPGRSVESNDIKIIYESTDIKIHFFIRKNKNDKGSKEFYYVGTMTPLGSPKQTKMRVTNKNVVEFKFRLDTPIKQDLYEYIIQSNID